MISEYLTKLLSELRNNPRSYFPPDKSERRRVNLELGRNIGYGLGIFEDWKTWAGTTYPRFIIVNSKDKIGAAITEREWMAAIKQGVENYMGMMS